MLPCFLTAAANRAACHLQTAARALAIGTAFCSGQAFIDAGKRLVQIQVSSDQETSLFPFVWLRDNCRCDACYHHATGQRKLLLRHLDVGASVDSLELAPDEERLHITWNDGHLSTYDLNWLRERSLAPQAIAARKEAFSQPKARPFGADFSPTELDFEGIMTDDRLLLGHLWALKRDGLALLSGTPTEGAVERLAKRVAFPMITTYGVFFDVLTKPDVTNLAYTSDTLGLHSDLPYMRQLPGFQVLQCIEQTPGIIGGENQISDARHVGRLLRQTHPDAFEVLTTERVRYWTRGNGFLGDYHIVAAHPVLKLDQEGEVAEIVYSDAIRDSLQTISAGRMEPWYRALRILHDLLMQEAYQLRLARGQTLIIDNTRVVHGRSGYTVDPAATRHLRGCYLPMDETESRLRRLVEAHGAPEDD